MGVFQICNVCCGCEGERPFVMQKKRAIIGKSVASRLHIKLLNITIEYHLGTKGILLNTLSGADIYLFNKINLLLLIALCLLLTICCSLFTILCCSLLNA